MMNANLNVQNKMCNVRIAVIYFETICNKYLSNFIKSIL
jgi:hypothetical protein